MIHAYDDIYLNTAQNNMAHLLDCAVSRHGMELETFYDLFLASSVAERFQNGDCTVIAGRSGAELCEMILEECGIKSEGELFGSVDLPLSETGNGKTAEFWTGWALAYYQWYSGMTFSQINKAVQIGSIRNMYYPYHEMDIKQFRDEMDRRIRLEYSTETRLGYYRKKIGMSQRQLAEKTEIPVRTIQQYEQRQKDINKARSAYLIRLSKALHCQVQELMEVL